MQTALDRRTFLKGAAAAGGGLASMGAVERLVARDALGKGRRRSAQPYGRLRPVPDQRGVAVLALPAGFSYVTFSHSGSTMSDGNPTPLALDGMGAFAGGAGHRAAAATATSCGSSATARTATRPVRPAASSATAARPTTRPPTAARARSSTTSAGAGWSRTSCRSTVRRSNCAGGIAYRQQVLAHGRGGRSAGPTTRTPRRASPSATVTCSRRPSSAAPASSSPASRSRRRPLLP